MFENYSITITKCTSDRGIWKELFNNALFTGLYNGYMVIKWLYAYIMVIWLLNPVKDT